MVLLNQDLTLSIYNDAYNYFTRHVLRRILTPDLAVHPSLPPRPLPKLGEFPMANHPDHPGHPHHPETPPGPPPNRPPVHNPPHPPGHRPVG